MHGPTTPLLEFPNKPHEVTDCADFGVVSLAASSPIQVDSHIIHAYAPVSSQTTNQVAVHLQSCFFLSAGMHPPKHWKKPSALVRPLTPQNHCRCPSDGPNATANKFRDPTAPLVFFAHQILSSCLLR
jgi:hypothetical protein